MPSYKNNVDKNSVIFVAVNDPYVLNGWAEKLKAKDYVKLLTQFPSSRDCLVYFVDLICIVLFDL